MSAAKAQRHSAVVASTGAKTHVLVPVDEYRRLTSKSRGPSSATVERALEVLGSSKTRWHDADDVVADILRDGLRQIRRSRGVTQAQLGRKLGMAQPRISRMEKSPDRMTVGLLRKVAAILAGGSKKSTARGEPKN
jgi:DNA-binding XRE family transcriptional regulator